MSNWAFKPLRYNAQGELKVVADALRPPPTKGRVRLCIPSLRTERATGSDYHDDLKLQGNITMDELAKWLAATMPDQAKLLRNALNMACVDH